jgi:glycerol uptake facilitator-like aquaporin
MLAMICFCMLALCAGDEPAIAPLIPLWEQQKGVPAIRWAGSHLDEARQEAQDRRVPILLWVIRDGDSASQSWVDQRLIDPDFISTLEKESVPAIVCLEALFAGPISGASMNPARSLGPALISGDWANFGAYVIGPVLGALTGSCIYEYLRHGGMALDDKTEASDNSSEPFVEDAPNGN